MNLVWKVRQKMKRGERGMRKERDRRGERRKGSTNVWIKSHFCTTEADSWRHTQLQLMSMSLCFYSTRSHIWSVALCHKSCKIWLSGFHFVNLYFILSVFTNNVSFRRIFT